MEETANQNSTFKHSVKMPQLYKEASKILKKFDEKQGALKTLIYQGKYKNYERMFALLTKCVQNNEVINSALSKIAFYKEQPRFDPYIARVLTAQLLSKGPLTGNCKPIEIFMQYQDRILAQAEDKFIGAPVRLKVTDGLPKYARINSLKINVDSVHKQLDASGFIYIEYDREMVSYEDFLEQVKIMRRPNYMEDYHFEEVLIFANGTKLFDHELVRKKQLILQDKASCLPVYLSNIDPGCHVIDSCAAPGNKTSLIAARINNEGKVIAVEMDEKRFNILETMVRERGASCVETMHDDFTLLKPKNYKNIKYIFVDPSCSASGTGLHEDTVSDLRLAKLKGFQATILKHALSFPTVKEVIYSTCSLHEEENEEVVQDALEAFKNHYEIADLSTKLKGWKNFGNPKFSFGHKCLKTDPAVDKCIGFFVAKFVRIKGSRKNKPKILNENDHQDDSDEPKILNENDHQDDSDEPKKKKKKVLKNDHEDS